MNNKDEFISFINEYFNINQLNNDDSIQINSLFNINSNDIVNAYVICNCKLWIGNVVINIIYNYYNTQFNLNYILNNIVNEYELINNEYYNKSTNIEIWNHNCKDLYITRNDDRDVSRISKVIINLTINMGSQYDSLIFLLCHEYFKYQLKSFNHISVHKWFTITFGKSKLHDNPILYDYLQQFLSFFIETPKLNQYRTLKLGDFRISETRINQDINVYAKIGIKIYHFIALLIKKYDNLHPIQV